MSCLFEYNKYIKKVIVHIKTPILFDASCSGIQHLSALTTDIDIAKLVNLVEASKDVNIETPYEFVNNPADFYSFCIKNIIKNIYIYLVYIKKMKNNN